MLPVNDYLAFAHKLADEAGDIACKAFKNTALSAELKVDASPVTLTDKAIEACLRENIRETYPHHGIIGEEYGTHQPNSEFCWVLDPIDGTRAFTCGIPTFTILIGLMQHNAPLLGIVSQPYTKERWHGVMTAPQDQRHVNTSDRSSLNKARFATTSPYLFSTKQRFLMESLREATGIQSFGGDAYNYMMLADGHIDVILEAGLKPHDILPILPILSQRGAIVSDWHGTPLDLEADTIDILVTANQALHQEALAIINTP